MANAPRLVVLVAVSNLILSLAAVPQLTLLELKTEKELLSITDPERISRLSFVCFFASWSPTSRKAVDMCEVASNLLRRNSQYRNDISIFKANGELLAEYTAKLAIDSFPTLLLFGPKFEKPVEYSGERHPDKILDWLKKQHRKFKRAKWLRGE